METLPGGFEVASRPALGTTAQVVLHGKHVGPAALRAMDGLLDDLDLEASRFRQDSELSRVNASSSPELEVSPGFAALLEPALEWARRTHGLLDPTVGRAVVNAGYTGDFVGLERDQSGPAPGKSPAPGWWQVELSGTHLRRPPGVVLDLGSTSKAQVADRAAAELLALSGAAVLVSLGGDLATAGAIPPGGWVVRVGDDHQGRMGAEGQTVVLTARALATSSRAVRQWRRGGEPMHHLIDPRRGLPADGPWRTVSVAAASCLEANALATAALAGGEAGRALLEGSGAAARLVTTDGRAVHLGGWTPAGEELPLRVVPGAAA